MTGLSGRARAIPAAAGLAIGGAAAWMLAVSWGRWPDGQVDFGRELYLPWRLSQGDVLYRDVVSSFGPLSPYLNASWFELFGVGLFTLVWCNLALLFVLLLVLRALLRAVGSPLSATAALLVFVLLFAFSQYLETGNYNYVTPYSHELVHGTLLALLALGSLGRFFVRPRWTWLGASGLFLGLAFLTKIEPWLAATLAVGLGVLLSGWSRRLPPGKALREAAVVLLCAALPVAVATGLLALAMPWRQAVDGVLTNSRLTLDPALSGAAFFRVGMGIDDPRASLAALGLALGRIALGLLPVAALAYLWRTPRWRGLACASTALGVLAVAVPIDSDAWLALARPLPVLMLGFGVVSLRNLVRVRSRGGFDAREALRFSLFVFALALLGKILLNTRFYHYGFVLAMPAALLTVVALIEWIPAYLTRSGGCGRIFQVAAAAWLACLVGTTQLVTLDVYSQKTHRVGSGRDRFLADEHGRRLQEMLEAVQRQVGEDQTLVVLPEGIMLNYLARRRSPLRLHTFLPWEFTVFGEQTILFELMVTRPDFVVVTHRDATEYGPRYFGRHYGLSVARWITRHYRPIDQVGASPLAQPARPGLLLLARSDG